MYTDVHRCTGPTIDYWEPDHPPSQRSPPRRKPNTGYMESAEPVVSSVYGKRKPTTGCMGQRQAPEIHAGVHRVQRGEA